MWRHRAPDIIGVVWIGVGILLLFSLISFHPNTPADNLAGWAGFYLSYLLFLFFGLAAYLLPLMSLLGGWSTLKKGIAPSPRVMLSGFGLFLLSVSALADLTGRSGGHVGRVTAYLLSPALGPVGTGLVLTTLLLLSLSLVAPFSITRLLSSLPRIWKRRGGLRKDHLQRTPPEIMPSLQEEEPPPTIDPARPVQRVAQAEFAGLRGDGDYQTPPLALLTTPPSPGVHLSKEELGSKAKVLEKRLLEFGIEGRVVKISPGPVITRYEFEPAPGIKVNRIVNLSDDLALSMKAIGVRIDRIPEQSAVGIEIPNPVREDVFLKEILFSPEFQQSSLSLPLVLGKDTVGKPVVVDLSPMPHLLIAGATGSGKSVALTSMVMGLLFSKTPREVKMVLIDPKMVELSLFEGIPHLLTPVITNPREAAETLRRIVGEMERRNQLLAEVGARHIQAYNQTTADPIPYLVVMIDELADLMRAVPHDVEVTVERLTRMARAVGIHLIAATQRPSVDVITAVIKANFVARVSFRVSSKFDSQTILDTAGAEQLLGKGDMLFRSQDGGALVRVHGAYLSDREIHKVVEHVMKQPPLQYNGSSLPEVKEEEIAPSLRRDDLYQKAIELVVESGQASASFIQRRLQVGYPRAARIIEMMEEDGIIGPSIGGKAREVLIKHYAGPEGRGRPGGTKGIGGTRGT